MGIIGGIKLTNKVLLVLEFMAIEGLGLFAQKKPLDHKSYIDWPQISDPKISKDGKFVAYVTGSNDEGKSLVIRSTGSEWEKEIPGAYSVRRVDGQFTEDSHFLIFKKAVDSLGILDLQGGSLKYISRIQSYKLPESGDGKWLAYKNQDTDNLVVVLNLETKKAKTYSGIEDYTFSHNGQVLVLQRSQVMDDHKESYSILWVDLTRDRESVIGHGYHATQCVFNGTDNKLALFSQWLIKVTQKPRHSGILHPPEKTRLKL